jgi:ubiquitin carboxyl-terminal hydrolase 25/28
MEGVEGPPPVPEKPDTEMKDAKSEQDRSQDKPSPPPPNEAAPSPPDRPPPVPPRPTTQVDKAQLIREEVELGAQQDVTEVINNVLFQAQCAIKPMRLDADGEPVDLITE